MPYQPFDAEHAPVKLRVSGKLVREWKMEDNSAGTPPLYPKSEGQDTVPLTLVPYGGARLRIAEFPLIGEREKAWKKRM
ncbi:hypothetical protein [Paenibacillus glycinis]|uniref:Uncharacterized protein n=1 Tax=Paenibacillus glycinis TaxID=2697035 RepID=A0ABW9XQB4_9BACL|nr:hypothetical protein [Paenibacillus glycinis]NBD24815.1 hypothetical protein [Paenibacillus glycinis]